MFKRLSIKYWRQFGGLDIELHSRLTVLTGSNGAGKTTLLNLLNRHFGWSMQFVSTPKSSKSGTLKFSPDIREDVMERYLGPKNEIGAIEYADGNIATLHVPSDVQESYRVEIRNQSQVPGLYISSHRPVYVYRKIEQIPTQLTAYEMLLENYLNELRNRYSSGSHSSSPSFRIKESLISLAIFGYGNEVIARNNQAVSTFEGYQVVLRKILPKTLGFQRIVINPPEIVLETSSGPFSFDAVSGGIAALIDISWQIYMRSLIADGAPFVVIIDEPENHLHPELQRSLLPDLISAFPLTQFIVATHNPFMVTAVPESNVYALMYTPEEPRMVVSSKLDLINKSASANEVLRDVLGVPVTMPMWVEEKMQQVVAKYTGVELKENSLDRLRKEMGALGLAHVFPETLSRVLTPKS